MKEGTIRSLFGLKSKHSQILDAVTETLKHRAHLGDARCYEAIFTLKRRHGASTDSRIKYLADRLVRYGNKSVVFRAKSKDEELSILGTVDELSHSGTANPVVTVVS